MIAPYIKPLSELPQYIKDLSKIIWAKYGEPKNKDMLVYSYFDTIYVPKDIELPPDLYKHEFTHFIQQGRGESLIDANTYWYKYAHDDVFRYKQEVEAYARQFQYIQLHQGKQHAFNMAKIFARDLSGPIYGNLCSEYKALQDIINFH
jgi:hypothetical protein